MGGRLRIRQGSEAVANTPGEFDAHIRAATNKWGTVIKAAKMKLD
jgi:hypothetical protein